ncbi:hypothetical protein QFZ20_003159 [Flavobacterium sp. W4I14]|nr:hypothetical protein [Flavobacterium sp. W4I14]
MFLLIVLILRRATTGNVSAQIAALYQPGKLIDKRQEFRDKKMVVAVNFPGFFPLEMKWIFLFCQMMHIRGKSSGESANVWTHRFLVHNDNLMNYHPVLA